MQRRFRSLLIGAIVATIPASAFASGSVPERQAPSRDFVNRTNLRDQQTSATSSSTTLIEQEPYDLGKALFGGKYKFGDPKLTAANVAEKKLRLASLRRSLPVAERGKMDPVEFSKRLTNHEMNALEYYVGMRFGKFITKSPSWAKREPPPKVALSE